MSALNPRDAKACCTCESYRKTALAHGECWKSPVKLQPVDPTAPHPQFERVGQYFTCPRYQPTR